MREEPPLSRCNHYRDIPQNGAGVTRMAPQQSSPGHLRRPWYAIGKSMAPAPLCLPTFLPQHCSCSVNISCPTWD